MRSTFVKQSMGATPLLTARDWLVFGGIVGAVVLLGSLLTPETAGPFLRGAAVDAVYALDRSAMRKVP